MAKVLTLKFFLQWSKQRNWVTILTWIKTLYDRQTLLMELVPLEWRKTVKQRHKESKYQPSIWISFEPDQRRVHILHEPDQRRFHILHVSTYFLTKPMNQLHILVKIAIIRIEKKLWTSQQVGFNLGSWLNIYILGICTNKIDT